MAPSPFSAVTGQTGVWTGTEVIVWGADGISADPVGGRYNPETNLWKPISLVDAPGAYVGSMAVWTGSGMLIWQPEIRTGSRYNPVLDKWSSMSTSGAPTIRSESSVVWTGTEMIIWGGSAQSVQENTGGRYDPVLNKWTAVGLSGAPQPRSRHSAVWTGSEMIIWGGENETTAFATGGRYNPAQNTWKPVAMAGAPPARIYRHPAAWTGSRLFLPGFTNTGYYNRPGATYQGGRYNPVENKWETPLTEGPTFSLYERGVWTGKEMIMWGYNNNSLAQEYITVRYDESTGNWVNISAGRPRSYSSPVWTGTQLIVRATYNQQPVTFSYTPPRAAFRVTTVALEGGSVMLTFPSIVGHRYTLWQSNSLAEGSWNPAGPASLPGTGSAPGFTVPANTSRQRFFRVQQAAP